MQISPDRALGTENMDAGIVSRRVHPSTPSDAGGCLGLFIYIRLCSFNNGLDFQPVLATLSGRGSKTPIFPSRQKQARCVYYPPCARVWCSSSVCSDLGVKEHLGNGASYHAAPTPVSIWRHVLWPSRNTNHSRTEQALTFSFEYHFPWKFACTHLLSAIATS